MTSPPLRHGDATPRNNVDELGREIVDRIDSSEGFASQRSNFDELGRESVGRIVSKEGFATQRSNFDELGREIVCRILRKEGCATQRISFDELGCEIVGRILSSVSPISLAFCSGVCSSWRDVVTSSSSLWRSAYCLDHRRRLKRCTIHKPSRAAPLDDNEKKEQGEKEGEKKVDDLEFRALYIEEEQRTRLAVGPVYMHSWRGHAGRVNCCRMVMEEVVSGSSDGTIRVWSAGKMGEMKCSVTYKVPAKAAVVQVEFDESKVMGAAGKDVFVWSRTGSRRLLKKIGGQDEICSFCVADSDLAMGCADGTVRVFDLYSSRCAQIFRKHTEPVKGVVMDSATQAMASGSSDGTVQLFDARSGQRIVSFLRPSSMTGISCLHLSPLGHKLFAGSLGGHLYCFDLRQHKTLWNARVGSPLTCMDSPAYSSSAIGVGGVDGAMNVFDVECGNPIATFQVKPPRLPCSPVLGMALGMTRLISCHADWNIVQWQFGESNSILEGRHLHRLVVLPS